MKTHLTSLAAAAAFALTLAGTATAGSGQLAASAGLTPAEAAGLSLTEVAQVKFNHDTRGDERHPIVAHAPASAAARASLARYAGPSAASDGLSLTEIAAEKFNREGDDRDAQRIDRSNVTLTTRSVRDDDRWAQLVSSAGLDPSDARGLSLTDIAAAKFDRDTD